MIHEINLYRSARSLLALNGIDNKQNKPILASKIVLHARSQYFRSLLKEEDVSILEVSGSASGIVHIWLIV